MTPADFLALLAGRGVKIRLRDGDRLTVQPADGLTPDELDWVRLYRAELTEHLADDGRRAALDAFDAAHGLPRFDGSELDGPRVLIPDGPGRWFVMLQADYDFLRAEAREARARADRAAGNPERKQARRPTGQTEIA